MKIRTLTTLLTLASTLVAGMSAPVAASAEIGSFCRLQGAESITVSGVGIVTGLAGTGDQSKAAKILTQKFLDTMRYSLALEDLASKNIALVEVSAEVPPLSRVGDKIRLRVASNQDASSLKDGILKACFLASSTNGPAIIRASGRITTGETPTTGIINSGGEVLDTSLLNRSLVDKNGIFRLLLERPNYGNAATIAQNINSDQRTNPSQGTIYGFPEENQPVRIVARARDAKEVIVQIPDAFKNKPVEYIAVVMSMDVPLTGEAVIHINRQTGIVSISGDVRVSPGLFSFRGRTVSFNQPQSQDGQPLPATYNLDNQTPRPVADVFGPNESAGVGRRSLQSLIDTLAAMRCTTDDIITIIKSLKNNGMIQAKIEED